MKKENNWEENILCILLLLLWLAIMYGMWNMFISPVPIIIGLWMIMFILSTLFILLLIKLIKIVKSKKNN